MEQEEIHLQLQPKLKKWKVLKMKILKIHFSDFRLKDSIRYLILILKEHLFHQWYLQLIW